MTAVGQLVLVLGLLVSVQCEVRARDPEVEEEEEVLGGGGGGGGGGVFHPPHLSRLHPETTDSPPVGERGNYPARTGNWCAFVQKRVVTMAVVCGTEKYVIKSQSPCPSRIPDCQLVMYKLSTRPVYTQKQKIFTTLHWACCQGHGGYNCEDTVPDPQLDSEGSGPEKQELRVPVQMQLQQQRGDPNREQNDHDATHPVHQNNTTHRPDNLDHAPKLHHTWHHTANAHGHEHQEQQQEQNRPVADQVDATVDVLAYPEAPAALPVPHMMALVMSQLQPVLEGFNRSLEHLSQQVGELAHNVAQLRSSQRVKEPQPGPTEGLELDDSAEERLDARLDEVFQHIRQLQRQMESQKIDVENRLHSQHAMLHYNFTSLKTDIDGKLKRHQKMLQVSLQAMNATVSELKLDQDQSPVHHLEGHPIPSLSPPQLPQPSDTSALWKAIERLDNTVVNNTVKVSGLMEDVEVTLGKVQLLKRDMKEVEDKINQTARRSQILFMETGLEVEDAKVAVLRRVNELAGNLTLQGERLQEMDVDVDYLYTTLYKNGSSGDCKCKALKAAMARLEKAVANVTELARENRLALDENSEGGAEQWGRASDWVQTVEALQHGLQQVKESLALEQSSTRTLDHSLNELSSSVTVSQAEISVLKKTDREVREHIQHLSGSFQSLLKDVIRHSDVLELLLGEEVLEFLEWPIQDQEAHSIPALKEQLREHSRSIASLLENSPGGRVEVPSADQPSSPSSSSSSHHLLHGDKRRSSGGVPARDRQLLLHPELPRPDHEADGSDLWNLEKMVEELGLKVRRLEGKPCLCSNTSTEGEVRPAGVDAKLQAEVMWLKRGLEEHLRVFKNVFSNADVLAGSDATLELDKVWELVKNKDGKKEKRGGEKEGRGGKRRSRRDLSGVSHVPSGLSDDSLLFVAGSPLSVSNSSITFGAAVKRSQFHPDTFTAPANGFYLFILTLDLRPGPVHVVLRRGSGGAFVSLHRQRVEEAGPVTGVGLLLLQEGEEVRLEMRGGVWVESENNVFTGLLLHRTT